jgi:uncharacterized iron-regulated protein
LTSPDERLKRQAHGSLVRQALRGGALVGALLAIAPAATHALDEAPAPCRPGSDWFVPATGANAKLTEVTRALRQRRVVLLGEHHDNPDHHRWQLHTVAALAGVAPRVALAFEMFPRRVQPILDAWVGGTLTEDEFLRQIDWDSAWSFDVAYYLPLFHFARLHRVPMIALNVDRGLFNRVARDGWEAVPAAEREGIGTPAPASKEYLRYLAGSFLRHNPADAPGSDPVTALQGQRFLRFVQGQQLWDRAMAQAVAAAVSKSDAALVIGIIGSGHLAHRFGVPAQLADLGVDDVAVALPWDPHFHCDELTPTLADFVFGVTR